MSKTLIPNELKETDFHLNLVEQELSNDYSLDAEGYKEEIKKIVQQYQDSDIDKYTAFNQIHKKLVYYDYFVIVPREERKIKRCILIYNPNDKIERLIKEHFYEEQIFPTKKAIYYAIGFNNLNGGKQKRVAESTVKQYADIQPVENSKRQQQIMEIYEIPHYIEKEDHRGKRGKFRDQLIPISVNCLLELVSNEKVYNQDSETVIYTNVNELAFNFGLISADYQNISYDKLEEINSKFTPYVVSQFYYFSKPQVKSKVFSTLDILQDEYRVLTYYRNYLITTNDNKSFISDKAHDNIIRKAERAILKEMGYSSLSFIFRAKKENEFYKKVIFHINTNYKKNWQRYKQQIEIHIDNDELKELYSQLDSMADIDISKRKSLLSSAFSDTIFNYIKAQVRSRNKKADEEEKDLIKTFSQDIQDLLECEVLTMTKNIYPLFETKEGKNEIKPYKYSDNFLITTQELMIIMLP